MSSVYDRRDIPEDLQRFFVRAEIGHEDTLQAYIERLVGVFESIKRVLRDDGCMFVNMGDGFDAKNLMGQPWRLAFGLQDAGWILRSDIIWAKPNPMPEPVRDRPTKSHEYVFLFSKKERYYYDAEAVKEKATGLAPGNTKPNKGADRDETRLRGALHKIEPSESRNLRTVWTIASQPEDLVELCIKAGSKPGDTILDPFSGTGTTGVVALKHGRDYIGIDISEKYQRMARKRLAAVAPLFCKEDPC